MSDNTIAILRHHATRHEPDRLDDVLADLAPHDDATVVAVADALHEDDAEVRVLALNVLRELGGKAEPVLSKMIKALEDKDRIVRICALEPVASFGAKAKSAIPILRRWLTADDEFCQVTAAGHVLMIAPSTTSEMMPFIDGALSSENLSIQRQAKWLLDQLGMSAASGLSG